MKRLEVIYIAGPYSVGDMQQNISNAIEAGNKVLDLGLTPIVPHLFHYLHQNKKRGYEEWMKVDFNLLGRADAVWRLFGESPGADREEARAAELGIPVFRAFLTLAQYIDKQNGAAK